MLPRFTLGSEMLAARCQTSLSTVKALDQIVKCLSPKPNESSGPPAVVQQQQQQQQQRRHHAVACWQQQQHNLQHVALQQDRSTFRCFSASLFSSTATKQSCNQQQPLGSIASLQQQQRQLVLHHWQQQQQQQQQMQWQQVRGVKLRPYALAPKPLPRYRKPSKDGRMNRMVIRVPPQVQLELQGGRLTFSGKAGSRALALSFLDPTGLVAWQCFHQTTAAAAAGPGTGSLLLLVSPSKRCWRGIQTHIDNAVQGVTQGFLVGLTVQGVGYRMEPVPESTVAAALAARRGDAAAADGSSKRRLIWETEAEKTNIAYPHKQPAKAVRLKVGFSRACIFQLPDGVLGFFVKPTLMYLYGIDKALVTNTAAAIRAVRKPNAYTGNGIQLVGETLKLKQRAGSK